MTAVSVLDDRTVAAIRDAIAAARSGRVPEAVSIGERALANGGDAAALNAMLGSLHCQTGNLEAGIRHLRSARAARPSDPIIASNLATALAQQGDHADALEVLTEEVAKSDPSLRLQRIRAFLAQEARRPDIAIPVYESVVSAAPDDWESWNNLGNARRLAGDADGALEALDRAAKLNAGSSPVRLNFAMALGTAGRVDEAEEQLRRMADDFPNDPLPLRELHALLKELGREEEALETIDAAVRRAPADVELLLARASQLLMLLRTDAAEQSYREAVRLEPENPTANLGLAVVFELTNRTTDLAELVNEAKERGVGEDALNFIQAFKDRRERRYDAGLAALAKVPEELESVRRWHLLGQLNDGAGQFDDAFDAFTRMNELQRIHLSQPEARGDHYRETVRSSIEVVSPEWARAWRTEERRDERPTPVFLVGFPRSGTTLLDTMLMGHPEIEVLEEEPTLREAEPFLPELAGYPTASDEQISAARDAYFDKAASLTPLKSGNLLVDKNPLSLNNLPLIRRIFPDARIILALRHPCDVVLSCYTTNFMINEGMASFLRLDTAAELYDLSFRYFEKARDLLDMPVHTVTYEQVVADRTKELKSLMQSLELDWTDDILDHETTAKKRGRIKTASYAQVAQPIYDRSAGRWQSYRKHLEPVLPVLEPWVRKFGYSL